MGNVGGCRHFRKRLLTLLLDDSKLRNFLISVKNEATVDALWICILITAWHVLCRMVVCHIQREASVLLVLQRWAMRRPRIKRRVTVKTLTLFSYNPESEWL